MRSYAVASASRKILLSSVLVDEVDAFLSESLTLSFAWIARTAYASACSLGNLL